MDLEQRDFKGVWIPRDIYLDNNLSAIEKIILTEISSLDRGDGCYASNEYLAEFCQCSISKVKEAIAKLKEYGCLELKSFDGRTRVLRSIFSEKPFIQTDFGWQTARKCPADSQKVAANNIDNNIINNNIEEKTAKTLYNLFSSIYFKNTNSKYIPTKKDFVLLNNLLKALSYEEIEQRIYKLEELCLNRTAFFTKDAGFTAFTIGKLVSMINQIIPNKKVTKKKETTEREWNPAPKVDQEEFMKRMEHLKKGFKP